MASKKAPQKAAKKPGTRQRRGVTIKPTELLPKDLACADVPPEISELEASVTRDGGAVLARYREPLGGHYLLLAALPVEAVTPTPFQRDVSDAHVRKLTRAMDKTKRFLDPIIVVRTERGYMTPNGNHRLTCLKELGAKSVVCLLVPETRVAYQILALNIEKAHALRERALEVVRMYRDLSALSQDRETSYELEFEEPALVTLGFAYEKRPRLAGGQYHPVLKRVDGWIDASLKTALAEREERANMVVELDEAVNTAVSKLKERGLTSPYLKTFVVARINPLRFIKGDPPPMQELFATMTRRAQNFKANKVKTEDVARTGGFAEEE